MKTKFSFHKLILGLFLPSWSERDKADLKERFAYLEGFFSSALNFLLFLLKLVLGWASGSLAIISDGFHSLSDVFTSAVVIVGAKLSSAPEDEEHPFGHGRIEYIATVIMAVLLFVAGFELVKDGLVRVFKPQSFSSRWSFVAILFFTILLKEYMASFAFYLGNIVDSDMLRADAWHHRSDSISTVIVILSLILAKFKIYFLDGVITVGIGAFIWKEAYSIVRGAADKLIGQLPKREFIERLKEEALTSEGVIAVHDIIVHQYGDKKIVSLHIELPNTTDFDTVHKILDGIEDRLKLKLNIDEVITHPDPVDLKDPYRKEIREYLKQYVQSKAEIHSFHDVRLIDVGEFKNVVFDIVFQKNVKRRNYKNLLAELRSNLKQRFPYIKSVIINVEPLYSI